MSSRALLASMPAPRAGLKVLNSPLRPQLPTVEALDRLWNEVASRPLWAPPNFFRYLRLRWRMRMDFIDSKNVSISAPAGQINDCSSCTENCCIGPHSTVSLRLHDIATLIDISRTDLITHDKPRFSQQELEKRPALKRHVSSRAWNAFPVLRKNSFGACAALNTAGRCTIFPHWPLSCARFPYALHLSSQEVYFSPRCRSFWIDAPRSAEVQPMALAAVASYNERIKDQVLLAYAYDKVAALGLTSYLIP